MIVTPKDLYLGSPFASQAIGDLVRHSNYSKERATITALAVFEELDMKRNISGQSMELLGVFPEGREAHRYAGSSLEDFLSWATWSRDRFRITLGGSLHTAFIQGKKAATKNFSEEEKLFVTIYPEKALATFYHVAVLENWDEQTHVPMKNLSSGVEAFFTNILEGYPPGLVNDAVRAFWEYLGFAVNEDMVPIPWW